MRFGRCRDCGEYIHLIEDARCKSCLPLAKEHGNWMIIYGGKDPSNGKVCRKGLSKSEACGRAAQASFLYPYKQD